MRFRAAGLMVRRPRGCFAADLTADLRRAAQRAFIIADNLIVRSGRDGQEECALRSPQGLESLKFAPTSSADSFGDFRSDRRIGC